MKKFNLIIEGVIFIENLENKINFSDIQSMDQYREYIRQKSKEWYKRNSEYKKQYSKAYYQKKKLEKVKEELKNQEK